MAIVTLTSDFGTTDYYAAIIKGAILAEDATLNIIDITHNIKNYDIVQGAFVLKNAYYHFPKGTIHLLSVNNFYSKQNSFLVLRYDGHYFIGPDNGIFSLMFEDVSEDIYELDYPQKTAFPLKHLYANAVGHLIGDKPFNEIGFPVESITQRITLQPVISQNMIRGSIIHIDKYENAVTNISRELFDRVHQGRDFSLYFKRHEPLTKLSWHYYDVPVGENLCLFNSANYLEISINMGKASSLLGLKVDDTIQIDFE
ncbi:MAG: S-adenosyl-l-methionine hydroxide adenosyltransferase family protein [Saprospiraceae bacterium]